MRGFTAAVLAVLMCFLLLKNTEGTGGGGDDGGRVGYAGAYYRYGDDPYGYEDRYNPYHNRNGYGDVYDYHNDNNHYDYYPYEYNPLPSEPLQEGPKCTNIQECPPGYYFSTEGCVCVPKGIPTTPQKHCTLSSAVCNRRQHLNLDTCSCECVEYSLIIPGIPAIPAIPGRFVDLKIGDQGKNRGTPKGSRRKSSKRRRRGAEDSLDNEELIREAEGRFERSKSSRSRSGSSSGSRSSSGKVFIPGQPAIPARPSFIQLVTKCPPKTEVDEINCKCDE